MNKVNLLGRIVNDLELKTTNGNKKYTRFTLAVRDSFSKDKTDFINIMAWEKTAELITTYFKKGELLALSGRIQTGSYEKDGKKVYTFEINAAEIYFLKSAEGTESKNNKSQSQESPKKGKFQVYDEEMPF